MRKLFLTLFYSGLSPKAPGTVGTFVALILGIGILQIVPPVTLFLLTLLITVIAVKQINIYENQTKQHDSKEIVIDELAGMWLALSISGASAQDWIPHAIIGFLLFRFFDIFKPSIIGRVDKEVPGGWGVMGDDLIAGLFAGLTTVALMTYVSL